MSIQKVKKKISQPASKGNLESLKTFGDRQTTSLRAAPSVWGSSSSIRIIVASRAHRRCKGATLDTADFLFQHWTK